MRPLVRALVFLVGVALVIGSFAMFITWAGTVYSIGDGKVHHGIAFVLLLIGGFTIAGAITAQGRRTP